MPGSQNNRLRSRVRIELPIRVRQIGPPRDFAEITRTVDASRNGILFRSRERYDVGTNVWVMMPYRRDALAGDLEFPGSIVRVQAMPDGLSEIALQFHSGRSDRQLTTMISTAPPVKSSERRERNRVRVELPIRVRDHSDSEESVTVDVSRAGVLFRSDRAYPLGRTVWVVVPYQRGGQQQETPAQVVRAVENAGQRAIALQYTSVTPAHTVSRGF